MIEKYQVRPGRTISTSGRSQWQPWRCAAWLAGAAALAVGGSTATELAIQVPLISEGQE